MKSVLVSDLHPNDFTVEGGLVRVTKPYNWYTIDWGVDKAIATTTNPRAYLNPQFRMLSVLDGTGKIHLEFKVLQDINEATALFKLPADAPNNLDKIAVQTWDGGTIWCNGNNKSIYAKGLKAGHEYAVDLIGFFGE